MTQMLIRVAHKGQIHDYVMKFDLRKKHYRIISGCMKPHSFDNFNTLSAMQFGQFPTYFGFGATPHFSLSEGNV